MSLLRSHTSINVIDDYWAAAASLLDRLMKQRETVGVCILGSAARSGERPYVDTLSDIDIAVFLDFAFPNEFLKLRPLEFQRAVQSLVPKWLPNFKFVLADATATNRFVQVNVHQLVLPYEESTTEPWPAGRREAFKQTCDVVYDPTGRVKELIARKSAPSEAERMERISRCVARVPILLEHAVTKAAKRQLFLDAHLALNECVECILALLFEANHRDAPDIKWRSHIACQLSNAPSGLADRLARVVLGEAATAISVERRAREVLTLYQDVISLLHRVGLCPEDAYGLVITQYNPGWQLRFRSAADEQLTHPLPYAERMSLESWNRANVDLAVSAS